MVEEKLVLVNSSIYLIVLIVIKKYIREQNVSFSTIQNINRKFQTTTKNLLLASPGAFRPS